MKYIWSKQNQITFHSIQAHHGVHWVANQAYHNHTKNYYQVHGANNDHHHHDNNNNNHHDNSQTDNPRNLWRCVQTGSLTEDSWGPNLVSLSPESLHHRVAGTGRDDHWGGKLNTVLDPDIDIDAMLGVKYFKSDTGSGFKSTHT